MSWLEGSTWEKDILEAREIYTVRLACYVEIQRLNSFLDNYLSDSDIECMVRGEMEMYENTDSPSEEGPYLRILKISQWCVWICEILETVQYCEYCSQICE